METVVPLVRFKVLVSGRERLAGERRYTNKMLPITKISWGKGPFEVDKIWYHFSTATPLTFSKSAAEAVAKQLRTRWRFTSVEVAPVEVK